MKKREILVRADVLKSLRYSAKVRTSEVLQHFSQPSKKEHSVDSPYLKSIEASDQPISLSLLKEFGRLYKYPLSCFLLPKPLKEDSIPPDFRKRPSSQKGDISSETALVLRHARRAQYVAQELSEVSTDKDLPLIKLSDNPEVAANLIRKYLKFDLSEQKSLKSSYELFWNIRERLEQRGILVIKISFPVVDASAFSLTDQQPYVAVINNKDGGEYGYSPKVFSLLHEFAHILLREGGLCNTLDFNANENHEVFCNAFAAAFFIPKEDIELILEKTDIGRMTLSEKISFVDELRKIYKISGEVLIRRIAGLGFLSRNIRDDLIENWNVFAEKYRKSFIPMLSQAQKCFNKNGEGYVQLVLNAQAKGAITPEIASDYLGLKLKYLPDLHKLAGS